MIRYPAALAEVGGEPFRKKLLTGVATGYATFATLLVLALVAHRFALLRDVRWAFALLAIKCATNTFAWLALVTRRAVIEASMLNIVADVLLMTGGVYYTGGPFSPLISLYFLEVAVMALLTNVGLTVATVIGAFGSYVSMVALMSAGLLPRTDSIVPTQPTAAHVVVMSVYVACALFVPGVYVATIVQKLRDRERALEQRARELVDASRVKSEFTANITHELRTPLHGILGMSELIDEGIYGAVTEKQRGALGSIRSSATGLLEMIDGLLVLARDEALGLEVNASTVELREVLAAIAGTARMLVGSRPLTIELAVSDGTHEIKTDRKKLVQILVNLVANAVKFTEDGGRVRVALEQESERYRIVIEDTGKGIRPSMIDRVFEPYVQEDGSAERAHGGAGLGLAVVRKLSTLLGMRVSVQSTVGEGSTFTLEIPKAS